MRNSSRKLVQSLRAKQVRISVMAWLFANTWPTLVPFFSNRLLWQCEDIFSVLSGFSFLFLFPELFDDDLKSSRAMPWKQVLTRYKLFSQFSSTRSATKNCPKLFRFFIYLQISCLFTNNKNLVVLFLFSELYKLLCPRYFEVRLSRCSSR